VRPARRPDTFYIVKKRSNSYVVSMQTMVDIDEPLLREARQLAARDGTTLSALVERALQQVVAERAPKTAGFKLRDASIGGDGPTDEFRNATPDQRLEVMYGRTGAPDRD
jgi:hypothetical protein